MKKLRFPRRLATPLAAILTIIVAWLFWWLRHPEMLYYQEQYQMWQSTLSYLISHLATPGGMAAYTAEFLTQMNLYPALGALIIALQQGVVLLGVTASVGRLKPLRPLRHLAALAAVITLNWIMGDENLLPSFLLSLALLSAAVITLILQPTKIRRIALAVVITPLLAWTTASRHYRLPHQFLTAPGFSTEKCQVLRYDMLVRLEEWDRIIQQAEHQPPTHPLGIQALNLALAKTHAMGDRMFQFPQCGVEGIIYPWRNNCVDNIISSEVAWHTGLLNTAFRYAFDSQEAIPDKRKSARLMKRLAECCIVNGDYNAARKYLLKLSHTTLYRLWAKRATQCLGNEAAIGMHPVWGEKRACRFQSDYLFSYPEIAKLFALLSIESQGRNLTAWHYFNALTLLRGDLSTFAGMSHYSTDLFAITLLPRHYQEAWALLWTMTHSSFDGIPVALPPHMQRQAVALAADYAKHQGRLDALEPTYHGTYWLYYLRQQANPQPSADATTSASPHN